MYIIGSDNSHYGIAGRGERYLSFLHGLPPPPPWGVAPPVSPPPATPFPFPHGGKPHPRQNTANTRVGLAPLWGPAPHSVRSHGHTRVFAAICRVPALFCSLLCYHCFVPARVYALAWLCLLYVRATSHGHIAAFARGVFLFLLVSRPPCVRFSGYFCNL